MNSSTTTGRSVAPATVGTRQAANPSEIRKRNDMMILRRFDKPFSLPGVGCYATRTTQNLESLPLGPNHAFAARVFARWAGFNFRPSCTGSTSLASSTSLRVATTQPGATFASFTNGCCVLDRARADVARLSAKIFGPHAHHCEPGTVDERNDGAARAKGCNAPAHVNLHGSV